MRPWPRFRGLFPAALPWPLSCHMSCFFFFCCCHPPHVRVSLSRSQDDAAECQFGHPLHDIHDAQAVCAELHAKGAVSAQSVTFGMGVIAGLVTMYTTMPLECVGRTAWWANLMMHVYACVLLVCSRRACTCLRLEHNTAIRCTAHTASLWRRVCDGPGQAQRHD